MGTPRYKVTGRDGQSFEREIPPEKLALIPPGFSITKIEEPGASYPVTAPAASVREPEAGASSPVPLKPQAVQPPAVSRETPGMWARAYSALKSGAGQVAETLSNRGPLELLEPEIRGIAHGSTLGLAENAAPVVGWAQEGLERLAPVDAPGTPQREYAAGSLAADATEAERRGYATAREQHPIRYGAGVVLGSLPFYEAAAPYLAPVAGASRADNFVRAAAGLSALGGAQEAHTGDPARVAEGMAIGAALPAAVEGVGMTANAVRPALRETASRFRLAQATGQMPYGRWIRRLVKEKGPEKMARMGEVVEESPFRGKIPGTEIANPLPGYKTAYTHGAEQQAEEAGSEIAAIHSKMGGSQVDIGPTIKALRSKAEELIATGDNEAIAQARPLLEKADNYEQLTVGSGRPRMTAQQIQQQSDAAMSRAAEMQNEAISRGAPQEEVQAIWDNAESRVQAARDAAENPTRVGYTQAHGLRKWLDSQAWSHRSGDMLQRAKADQYRDLAGHLRGDIATAIEREAPELSAPLRAANERYEAASWIKHHGDAGASGRTSELVGAGSGALGHNVGTGIKAYLAAEGIRRFGPGAVSRLARTGQGIAGALGKMEGGFAREVPEPGVGRLYEDAPKFLQARGRTPPASAAPAPAFPAPPMRGASAPSRAGIESLSAQERHTLAAMINSYSESGHPMATAANLGGFTPNFALEMAQRAASDASGPEGARLAQSIVEKLGGAPRRVQTRGQR